jgi:hypothetical protein
VLKKHLKYLCEELKMETAIASFIDQDSYYIVEVHSEMEGVFHSGMHFPLQDTYCRAVYETESALSYLHVGSIETMLQHPVYQAVKLESYLGLPIKNKVGSVIGTVNLTSLSKRDNPFSETETQKVKDIVNFIESNIDDYILSARAIRQ